MRYPNIKQILVTILLGFLVSPQVLADGFSHGLSIYGPQDLKYGEDEPYACANPDAPKGGTLRMAWIGAFTKLNYFSLKGVAPPRIYLLVFETLMDGSPDEDEPFSQYGLLAEKALIAEDRMSVTYQLRKEATFSDGRPVTADDVVFSFNLIQDPEFLPFFKAYYSDVDRAEKIDDHTVRFVFKQTNQELPLIMGQLYVLPKHIYGMEGKRFGADFDDVMPVGTGPYVVESYDYSKHVTYRRNPDYWGRHLSMNRGRFNFDRIIYRIYLDPLPAREALKGGLVDIDEITSSRDWALEFDGPYIKKGYLVKKSFPHQRVPGMQCFVMNLRNPLFRDRELRKVLCSLFDFEYFDKNQFYGQYTRLLCYWDNNPEMLSRGPAKGNVRRTLLELRKKYGEQYVPADAVLRGPYNVGCRLDGMPFDINDRIQAANAKLDEMGWQYDPEAGVRMKNGKPLRFEIMLISPGFIRLVNPLFENMRQAGIKAGYRLVQPAEYVQKIQDFQFDMMVDTYRVSESPGNEQRDYWSTEAADTPGSFNLSGIRNPAVDEMVDGIIAAASRKDLVEAVQVMDRILCANHYVIPQWYIGYDRSVFWNRFSRPARYAPKLYFTFNVMYWWWYDEEKEARLEAARKAGTAFNPAPAQE